MTDDKKKIYLMSSGIYDNYMVLWWTDSLEDAEEWEKIGPKEKQDAHYYEELEKWAPQKKENDERNNSS